MKIKATYPFNGRIFSLIKEVMDEHKSMISLATDKNAKIILNLVHSVIDYAETKAMRQE